MALCPLCNGLRKIQISCQECQSDMKDMGKAMDYADEYSAYMDIDTLKLNDGFPDSIEKGQCAHIMKCLTCNNEEIILIQE